MERAGLEEKHASVAHNLEDIRVARKRVRTAGCFDPADGKTQHRQSDREHEVIRTCFNPQCLEWERSPELTSCVDAQLHSALSLSLVSL